MPIQDVESWLHDQVTQCLRDIHEVAGGLEPKMQYCRLVPVKQSPAMLQEWIDCSPLSMGGCKTVLEKMPPS